MPIENKTGPKEFSCPPNQLDRMRRSMEDVTDVLVIGWRGNERHFLAEIKEHVPARARVSIVGRPQSEEDDPLLVGPSAVATCRSVGTAWLAAAGRRGKCRVYRTGFTGFVAYHLEKWLKDVTP
jgi:hypothetical protein